MLTDLLLLFDIILYFVFGMHELGILPKQKKVFFGQLFGMSDPISFTLGELYSVSEPYPPSLPPFQRLGEKFFGGGWGNFIVLL